MWFNGIFYPWIWRSNRYYICKKSYRKNWKKYYLRFKMNYNQKCNVNIYILYEIADSPQSTFKRQLFVYQQIKKCVTSHICHLTYPHMYGDISNFCFTDFAFIIFESSVELPVMSEQFWQRANLQLALRALVEFIISRNMRSLMTFHSNLFTSPKMTVWHLTIHPFAITFRFYCHFCFFNQWRWWWWYIGRYWWLAEIFKANFSRNFLWELEKNI